MAVEKDAILGMELVKMGKSRNSIFQRDVFKTVRHLKISRCLTVFTTWRTV